MANEETKRGMSTIKKRSARPRPRASRLRSVA